MRRPVKHFWYPIDRLHAHQFWLFAYTRTGVYYMPMGSGLCGIRPAVYRSSPPLLPVITTLYMCGLPVHRRKELSSLSPAGDQ